MKTQHLQKEFEEKFAKMLKDPKVDIYHIWRFIKEKVIPACIEDMTVGEKVFIEKKDGGLLPQEMLPEINMKHKVFVNAHNQARQLQIQQGKEIMEKLK